VKDTRVFRLKSCALVNLRGELIGIPSQILSQTGGAIGIGFAIPAEMTREVMD
jgi:S1-C subfamily serine protease